MELELSQDYDIWRKKVSMEGDIDDANRQVYTQESKLIGNFEGVSRRPDLERETEEERGMFQDNVAEAVEDPIFDEMIKKILS